jgi:hypothetical protein
VDSNDAGRSLRRVPEAGRGRPSYGNSHPVNATQIADSVRILANPKHQHALMQVTGRAFENGPLAMGSVLFSPSLVEYLAQKFAEIDGQLKRANNLS